MKKTLFTVVLLIGFAGFSQGASGGPHPKSHLKDLSAEQLATLQTKKLTLTLDLTEAQQQRVQQLNLETAMDRKAMAEKRKTLRKELTEKEISADQHYEWQIQRLDKAIAHKKKMRDILTEDQYAKWERLLAHKGKYKKDRMSKRGR